MPSAAMELTYADTLFYQYSQAINMNTSDSL